MDRTVRGTRLTPPEDRSSKAFPAGTLRRGPDDDLLVYAPEVRAALDQGDPVVALESSVIAHGLPYPRNLETAAEILDAVREAGAVPAMTAVADGRLLVGLDDAGLERLATAPKVRKVGNRDLGPVLAGGGPGATTLASALAVADRAGIPVVSTGGIGGVHRGASETFDISGDLVQLTRSRSMVVCAGAKSVLDLGLTLEFLETQGVPVIGHGCDEFPAYYCRTSGHPVPHRMDRFEDISAAFGLHCRAGLGGSVLVTVPVAEEYALDAAEMDRVIAEALADATAQGVRGPAITPHLMRSVSVATAGRSAETNRHILLGCARTAGRLAVVHTALASKSRRTTETASHDC